MVLIFIVKYARNLVSKFSKWGGNLQDLFLAV
jgi:hypothetical protein